MITFSVGKGELSDKNGIVIGPAYSGAPGHVDVVADDGLKALGPIPLGLWRVGAPEDVPGLGPFCLRLTPCEGTDAKGRGGFWFHGDNAKSDHSGSHGCIVAAHHERVEVWADDDHLINVVP